MIEVIIEIVMEYGAFPGIVMYLIYVITRDYKMELGKIDEKLDKTSKKIDKSISEQNEALNEIVYILERVQNTMANQMHDLMLKFVEKSSNNDSRGEK